MAKDKYITIRIDQQLKHDFLQAMSALRDEDMSVVIRGFIGEYITKSKVNELLAQVMAKYHQLNFRHLNNEDLTDSEQNELKLLRLLLRERMEVNQEVYEEAR